MTKILDGTKLSEKIFYELKDQISKLDVKPHLVALQVGDNAESELYINHKSKKANEIGMLFTHLKFPKEINEKKLIDKIHELNNDKNVDGIMVQIPLSKNIDPTIISQNIAPWKDVDGFHPLNKGLLDMNRAELISPTALGVYKLLESENINLKGKKVTIIGTGDITGKPTSKIMINNGATVSMCNINTEDISEFTKNADIIIAAAGQKHIITNQIIKEGAIVINVGITKENDGTYGDVDVENISKASLITPIIGGTGPMTVAFLLQNTLICYKLNRK